MAATRTGLLLGAVRAAVVRPAAAVAAVKMSTTHPPQLPNRLARLPPRTTVFALMQRHASSSSSSSSTPTANATAPSSITDPHAASAGGMRVFFDGDLPKAQVVLPHLGSRVFNVNVSRDVNFFLLQLQDEDKKSVESAAFVDAQGYRLSRSTLMADALQPGVKLVLNGAPHAVVLPTEQELAAPLLSELETLQREAAQLEQLKSDCDAAAMKFSNRVMWGGLVALCAQWGLMMRLTWFEYSWDVMEPIAYFLSFGTGILGYIFYVATRKEYTFENLGGHTASRRQQREYIKRGLDLERLQKLNTNIEDLQQQLDRIRAHKARWWR